MAAPTDYETVIRLAVFAAIFALVAGAERFWPRRTALRLRGRRWLSNLGILAIDAVLVRLLVPVGAVALAIIAQTAGWGLFNQIDAPVWLAVLLSVLALDFAIYLQHVMFHAVPVFWRLHRVHHADPDFDVTTGLRFHPLEILLSAVIKLGAVLLLGAPPLAVLLFEVLLNGTSMFNHSNLRLPLGVDRWLRRIVVTPDMHRVHHSRTPEETNSNFGFNLPWWDYLCGTYRAQPARGHLGMKIGLDTYPDARRASALPAMLMLPFVGGVGDYAINRRPRSRRP